MQIRYARKFKKQYARAPEKIKKAFKNRRNLFFKNPYALLLNNHRLKGKINWYRSINIIGDWRALYSQPKRSVVIFEVLATHSQLYR